MARQFAHPSRIVVAAVLLGLLASGAQVTATEAACQPVADGVTVQAAPDIGLAEALPGPFWATAWPVDRDALLQVTQQRVVADLEAIDAPSCYLELVPHIAERVAFLQPFEFLVAGYYDPDPPTRDELLQLYGANPRQALRQVGAVWPSPRSEVLIQIPAFFDLNTNQIYVNTRSVPPVLAANVLAHEFWHALAEVRLSQRADGLMLRSTGFWSLARAADDRTWRPVDENVAGGVPTYLMNEAVAIEMEVAATGLEHAGMRPDLMQAAELLHRMFEVAGRAEVLRLYLGSRSDELKAVAHEAMVNKSTEESVQGSPLSE